MKLYYDVIKSIIVVILCSVVLCSNAMDPNAYQRKSSFGKLIRSPGTNPLTKPQPLQGSRSQSFVDPKKLTLCLANYTGSIQKTITPDQAQGSRFLTHLMSSEQKFVFDPFISDEAIQLFIAYLQASKEPVNVGNGEKKAPQQLCENKIILKDFSLLSDVLLLAEQCEIKNLSNSVKYALITTMLKNTTSIVAPTVSDTTIQELIQKYGLDKLFIVMKDTLKKYSISAYSHKYINEPYSTSYEKKIVDITLSPDARYLVVTAKKTDEKEDDDYVGSFYSCCDNARSLKNFSLSRTGKTNKNSFLFTPDNEYCIVCSSDDFKVISCEDLSVLKTVPSPHYCKYRYFVMSNDGALLLVTTTAYESFIYKRSKDGLFEKSDVTLEITPYAIKPIFSHDNKEIITAVDKTLYRYDCHSGKELQQAKGDTTVQDICVHPKGYGMAVLRQDCCKIYNNTAMEKVLLTVNIDKDVPTRMFYSPDGSLFALATGRKCFVYTCGENKCEFSQEYRTRNMISNGTFFGDKKYLMLSDDLYCDIYDCATQNLLKDFDLMCFEGAKIIVSKDGSHLIITCKNKSTIFGSYPLQSFFKVLGNLLEKK